MVRHCVLLRWKAGTTPEAHDRVVAELHALPGKIGVIRRYEIEGDRGMADGNADLLVLAEFDDEDGWRTYQGHPEHQRVIADHIRPILAERSAIQFDG